MEAELSGVLKESIQLKIEDETLTISVNTQEEKKEEEKKNYISRERRTGNICRAFRLEGINEEKLFANYENGLLKIRLAKDERIKEKGRNIEIQ